MSRQSPFFLIAIPTLLTATLLAGCGSSDDGASTTTEPAKAATTSSAEITATSPNVAAPVAYSAESVTGAITTCNIERFDKASFQSAPIEGALSVAHSIGGWIASPQLSSPSFSLRFEDKAQDHYFQVPVSLSVTRPDVLANNPGVPLVSGFIRGLPAFAVPAGQYHVYLAVEAGGKISVCDSGRHVDFK